MVTHKAGDLSELWNAIKDHRCKLNGEFRGIRLVDFNLDNFPQAHENNLHREVGGDVISRIESDISKVIDVLSHAKITSHHLSCAGYKSLEENAALCIHYIDPETEEYYAMAIPGVTYIPK